MPYIASLPPLKRSCRVPRPDGSAPLASGLELFYALTEGGGKTCWDGVVGLPLSLSAPSIWSPNNAGYPTAGLVCTANNAGASAPLPAYLQIQPPATIAVGFRFMASSGVSQELFGFLQGTNSGNRTLAIDTAVGNIQYLCAGSNSTFGGLALTAGADYVAVLTIGGGTATSYLMASGAARPTTGGTASQSTLIWGAGTPYVTLGAAASISGRNPQAAIYWGGCWSRVLSYAEVAAISRSTLAIWPLLYSEQIYFPPPGTAPLFTGQSSGGLVVGGKAFGSAVFAPPAAGGAVVGGKASPSAVFAPPAAGGAVAGGTAQGSGLAIFTGQSTGGVVAGGLASPSATFTATAAGGAVAGGIAAGSVAGTYSGQSAGGAVLGGAVSLLTIFVGTSSGGTVLGGSAAGSSPGVFLGQSSGGLVLGGTAFASIAGTASYSLIDPNAMTVITTNDDIGLDEIDPNAMTVIIV